MVVHSKSRRTLGAHRAFVTHQAAFTELYKSYESEERAQLDKCKEPDNLSFFSDPVEASASQSSAFISGRERLTKLQNALDMFGVTRSKNQRMFHREMIKAIIPQIFRDDLNTNIYTLQKEFCTEEFKQEVMIVTPRRWGKTYAVAMFVAACAYAMEGTTQPFEQAIFSTGRRASQKLLELIFRFLSKLPGVKDSIRKHTVETVWIEGPGGVNDVRKIYSYPSKVKVRHTCVV